VFHIEQVHAARSSPLAGNVIRDNLRGLQKVPAASRYEIGSHPILGYELIALCPRRGNSMALNPPFSKFRSRVGMQQARTRSAIRARPEPSERRYSEARRDVARGRLLFAYLIAAYFVGATEWS
jgi:hypothetical protein